MSRAKKLLLVGLVLAIGIGLAWPYRKTASLSGALTPAGSSSENADDLMAVGARRPEQRKLGLSPGSPKPHIVAKMASTSDPSPTLKRRPGTATFDLANHPAIANRSVATSGQPATLNTTQNSFSNKVPSFATGSTGPTSRPAYATADIESASGEAENPSEIVHIVCNTDTLEKLAKRYLGDAGRALEIFDLNRDQLTNPHLLPIGAELKIPVAPDKTFD